MKHFSIITLFPESIEPYLNSSILKRAQEKTKKIGSKKDTPSKSKKSARSENTLCDKTFPSNTFASTDRDGAACSCTYCSSDMIVRNNKLLKLKISGEL